MFRALETPYLVPFDGSFSVAKAATRPPAERPSKDHLKRRLRKASARIADLQEVLYAHDQYALLLVFQAMDAAGKDGTIRAVLEGVNPAGCQVASFKSPSKNELDQDFLWRTTAALPQRGRIGVFNRSYYEEVLVVRVHPEYLGGQRIPDLGDPGSVWRDRYTSIRDHEAHLARNGTVVLKFWLNVSYAEQRDRFVARIDEPEKNWKFSAGDVRERGHWAAYMDAYQDALNATSRPGAPWYAIPADDKRYMRVCVAETIADTLASLAMGYPTVDPETKAGMAALKAQLLAD